MRKLVLIALGFAFHCVAQSPPDVRIALVVGNARYLQVPSLANPVNDALEMGRRLRALGFSVLELRDGSRDQMMQAISELEHRLHGQRAVAMFYYAGHGLQLDWQNYMVPVDANIQTAADVAKQTVGVDEVLHAMRDAGTRMNILVLDACRDSPFPGASTQKGLAQMDAPAGTFIAYATAPGNVAEDGQGQSHGLYTSFLLEELKRPGAPIEDVFKRVRFHVRQKSDGRQVPWESTSLEDEFVFQKAADANSEQVAQKLPQPSSDAKAVASAATFSQPNMASGAASTSERARDEKASEAAMSQEKEEWDAIASHPKPDAIYAFLQRHPNGSLSQYAQAVLERVAAAKIQPVPDRDGMLQVSALTRFQLGDIVSYRQTDLGTGVTRNIRQKVISIEGDDVRLDNGTIYTREGATIRNQNVTRFDPPRLDLPSGEYVVGARWTFLSDETNRRGRTLRTSGTVRIAALETVTVPAGTFKAYRLEMDSFLANRGTSHVTRWMRPEWGVPIKTIRERRTPGGLSERTVSEMIEVPRPA